MQGVAVERSCPGQGILVEQRHGRPGRATRVSRRDRSLARIVRHAQDAVLARVIHPAAGERVAPAHQLEPLVPEDNLGRSLSREEKKIRGACGLNYDFACRASGQAPACMHDGGP